MRVFALALILVALGIFFVYCEAQVQERFERNLKPHDEWREERRGR